MVKEQLSRSEIKSVCDARYRGIIRNWHKRKRSYICAVFLITIHEIMW